MSAALILHEKMLEAKENKHQCFVAFLDAKAAFDVVPHASLLRKLANDGISNQIWLLINDSFKDAQSRVKWANLVSEPFDITQGVRQGGILSAEEYKRFNNDLLNWLQGSTVGAKLGNIPCPSPTCADDITLMAETKHELQQLLDMCFIYSSMERFEIQPSKSMIIAMNIQHQEDLDHAFTMGGKNNSSCG
jgi:hypothetical protein